MIPYGKQDITEQDKEQILRILNSDFLTQGPQVPLFETKIAEYCNVKHAVASNSGTSSLHLACLALGLQEGDLVWTTPITFVASANCALYCKADIDFVDIDRHTFNICVKALQSKLQEARRLGKLPKIVIVVHMGGFPIDMKEIKNLSDKYGFRIIEDACHAIGSTYEKTQTGCCKFSDITIFSFHPVKLITTIEGGIATTNDSQLARNMQLLRSHGITRDDAEITRKAEPWYYEQQFLGYNYRMNDVQAALGISQLSRLDQYVNQRRQLASSYIRELEELPLSVQHEIKETRSAYHLFIIRINSSDVKNSNTFIIEQLRKKKIHANLHYIPVHTQPYFQKLGFKMGAYPEAELYYREALTLPLFPKLSIDDQSYIIQCLKDLI